MSALPKRFPNHPTDRQLRQWWDAAGWVQIDNHWVPTRLEDGARLLLRERPDSQWIMLLDGTLLTEAHGEPMTWENRYDAAHDAVNSLRNDWHGPATRFRPSEPWIKRDERVWLRSLMIPCYSG